MRIDLHVHTMFSNDSDLDPRHMIIRAKEIGLDAICVTEHNTYDRSYPILDIAREMDFTVFRGVELSTTAGHILVYGLTKDEWKRPFFRQRLSIEEVMSLVIKEEAVAIVAHPFKPGYQFYEHQLIQQYPQICAMEICNGQCTQEQNHLASALAQTLGLPGIGGSDAHKLHEIGRCYTRLHDRVSTERELADAIRRSAFSVGNSSDLNM
jgi:hypothetical protein